MLILAYWSSPPTPRHVPGLATDTVNNNVHFYYTISAMFSLTAKTMVDTLRLLYAQKLSIIRFRGGDVRTQTTNARQIFIKIKYCSDYALYLLVITLPYIF